jgi:formate transporter
MEVDMPQNTFADAKQGSAQPGTAAGSAPVSVPSLDDRSPQAVAEVVAQTIPVKKIATPWPTVVLLGLLAGAYIACGGLLSASVTFDMAAHCGIGLTRLVAGAVFSVGLMLVVIGGGELFTGNNLMLAGVLSGKIGWGDMLRHWGVVYVANFVGALLLALLFCGSGLWRTGDGALGAAAVLSAYNRVSLPFGEALLRGIGCNWLVCLAVWMALAARQTVGKVFVILFPIMAFVAIGFEHCVADMYFIPAGILLRDLAGVSTPAAFAPEALSWGTFVLRNLVPVTLGNIIGGGVFVGMVYWRAYVRPSEA